MNVLQVNTADCQGGADRVAVQLLRGFREKGGGSRLLVHDRQSNDPDVLPLPPSRDGRIGKNAMVAVAEGLKRVPGLWRAGHGLYTFAGGDRQRQRNEGREVFDYPESHLLLLYAGMEVDLVHAHNLHGHYFDLRFLEKLSQDVPLVITLHDEWMYTGHCVYSLGCERWQAGCGSCPHLSIPHALQEDGTRENWLLKQAIYQKSRIHIVTPSEWLKARVERSMLAPASLTCIPNGVDLETFKPGDMRVARDELGIPHDALVVLFVANQRNPFKDFALLERAAEQLKVHAPMIFVSVGAVENEERILGEHSWKIWKFESDPEKLAIFYQAADVFAFATRADNYPLVTLEAMACGKPVVATAVGGLVEQIEPDRGRLVPPGDPKAFAGALKELLTDETLRLSLGQQARHWAERYADEGTMIDHYETLYEKVLS